MPSLYRGLRTLCIRDAELQYLLGRRHDHNQHRRHVRLARRVVQYHRTQPMSAVLGWAAIGLLIWTLA